MDKKLETMISYLGNRDYIVLDRESTGFQPNVNYSKITELSAIKIHDGEIIEEFDELIDPEMPIPPKIVEITQITDEMVKGKRKWPEVIRDFVDFCGDALIVGQNIWTDIKFIDYFAQLIGLSFEPKSVDTMVLAKYVEKRDNPYHEKYSYKLEPLAKRFGIEHENFHRSMDDVLVTAALYQLLINSMRSEVRSVQQVEVGTPFDQWIKKDKKEKIAPEFEIRSARKWTKDIKGTHYERLYVKLYSNGNYGDVFYDFVRQQWCVKQCDFPLPDFDVIQKKVMMINHIQTEAAFKNAANYC